jgi:hypothetical protein
LRSCGGRQTSDNDLQFEATFADFQLTPTAEISAMLSTVVQDAINDQINYELFSSYQYLSMAAWCEHEQFVGCASWLRIQSQEEYSHAMRLYDFLLARYVPVKLKSRRWPACSRRRWNRSKR